MRISHFPLVSGDRRTHHIEKLNRGRVRELKTSRRLECAIESSYLADREDESALKDVQPRSELGILLPTLLGEKDKKCAASSVRQQLFPAP